MPQNRTALALVLAISLTGCEDGESRSTPDAGTADQGLADAGAGDAGDQVGLDLGGCPDDDEDGHGALPCGDDCDDRNFQTHPGATETCNAADDDCDATRDEDVPAGESCAVGVGRCSQLGVLLCVGGSYSECSAVALPPGLETCDTTDDDCDGAVDDDVPAGPSCVEGVGACRRDGVLQCADGSYSICDAVAGSPATESCNGVDDDCDGIVDEDAPAGPACVVGVGGCSRSGLQSCVEGAYSGCDAAAGTPAVEMCNGVDDDCDALTDEDVPGAGSCISGVGACARTGALACVGGSFSVCDALAAGPSLEVCNGVDDDCDGVVDDAVAPQSCSVGVGACMRSGLRACFGGELQSCDAVSGLPAVETCDGVDEDCDGVVDDGVPGCVGSALSVGLEHTCVRRGSVAYCWGRNDSGEIGDGAGGAFRGSATRVLGLTDVAQIAAGGRHTCARHASGTVSCWGLDGDGQLGDSLFIDRNTPGLVPDLSGVAEIALGGYHTCARLSSPLINA